MSRLVLTYIPLLPTEISLPLLSVSLTFLNADSPCFLHHRYKLALESVEIGMDFHIVTYKLGGVGT